MEVKQLGLFKLFFKRCIPWFFPCKLLHVHKILEDFRCVDCYNAHMHTVCFLIQLVVMVDLKSHCTCIQTLKCANSNQMIEALIVSSVSAHSYNTVKQ